MMLAQMTDVTKTVEVFEKKNANTLVMKSGKLSNKYKKFIMMSIFVRFFLNLLKLSIRLPKLIKVEKCINNMKLTENKKVSLTCS